MLRTARLLLRPARASDLDDLFAIMSDPETMRFWSTDPHPDPGTTVPVLERMIAAGERGHDFVIELDGRAVGRVGAGRLPEIGFQLRRDLWGRGLMSEALAAMIPHLFATSDVPELTADVDPLNSASLKLLAKQGFHETGRATATFFIAGRWADSVYLARARAG